MLPNTTASVPSAPVRIAVAANRASGGGLDPARLVGVVPGAELFSLEELDRIAAWAPDRIAVAGGDGAIAPLAQLAGRPGLAPAGVAGGAGKDFPRAPGLPNHAAQGLEVAAARGTPPAPHLRPPGPRHPLLDR